MTGREVGAVDEVEGAHEGHTVVNDEQLAVVAQVRAPEGASEGLERQHEVPVDAGGGHAFFEGAEAGVFLGADVVEQHSHGHPTGHSAFHGFPHGCGGGVPGHGINLYMDVAFGGIDGFG